jgi:hypothetical protein
VVTALDLEEGLAELDSHVAAPPAPRT